jgi:hypothetical protein
LNEEGLDHPLWRTRFGRGYGPFVRQTTEWMNEWMNSRAMSRTTTEYICDVS